MEIITSVVFGFNEGQRAAFLPMKMKDVPQDRRAQHKPTVSSHLIPGNMFNFMVGAFLKLK